MLPVTTRKDCFLTSSDIEHMQAPKSFVERVRNKEQMSTEKFKELVAEMPQQVQASWDVLKPIVTSAWFPELVLQGQVAENPRAFTLAMLVLDGYHEYTSALEHQLNKKAANSTQLPPQTPVCIRGRDWLWSGLRWLVVCCRGRSLQETKERRAK